tara:strand:- start:180 stop:647 length:468 start_codon:yes stop_codon:yes gene_type:complete
MPGYGRNNRNKRGSMGRRGVPTRRRARRAGRAGRAGRVGRVASPVPPRGRTHNHSYDSDIQRHWSTHPGGTMQSGLGYTHTDTGGPSHSHPFKDRTRAHMGTNAKGQGTMGYSHTHSQGGRQTRGGTQSGWEIGVMRKRSNKRRRKIRKPVKGLR